MDRVEQSVSAFKSGYSCSQAILAAYGPDFGLTREQALSISAGFGAGMGMGQTCGAVTGAFMILGLRHAGADCTTPQGRVAAKAAILEFAERFKNVHGTTVCRALLGCDISTTEGMERARKEGLFATVCPGAVRTAAELLEGMLR